MHTLPTVFALTAGQVRYAFPSGARRLTSNTFSLAKLHSLECVQSKHTYSLERSTLPLSLEGHRRGSAPLWLAE